MEFTREELELIKKLGLKVKNKTEDVQKLPNETRAIYGVVTCDLCGTVTKQYVRMEKYSDGAWKSGVDFTDEEINKLKKNELEVCRERVKSCWNCRNVLGQKEKSELVEMIVKIYAPIPSKKEIWKYIGELRKEMRMEQANSKLSKNKKKEVEEEV